MSRISMAIVVALAVVGLAVIVVAALKISLRARRMAESRVTDDMAAGQLKSIEKNRLMS